MDPKTSASQKLEHPVCVANRTHILHALETMNEEPINTDNDSNKPSDWIDDDVEKDITACPKTAGFVLLRNFGTDSTIETRSTNFYVDSNS